MSEDKQRLPSDRPPMLCLWEIHKQKPIRGSMCEARTVCDRTGVVDAAERLLVNALDQLPARPLDRNFQHAADELSPARLAELVSAELATLPQLEEDGDSIEDLRNRHDLLKSIAGREKSPQSRPVYAVVQRVLEERVNKFRSASHTLLEASPSELVQVSPEVRRSLTELDRPDTGARPGRALKHLVRALEQLPTFAEQLIPEVQQALETRLLEAAYAVFEQDWSEVIGQLVYDVRDEAGPRLEELLEEMQRRGSRFAQQRKHLVDEGEAYRQTVHQRRQAQLCGVTLQLPGPSSEEVASGMRAALRCRDSQELARKLWQVHLEQLRSLAAKRHPHLPENASATTLLLEIPVVQQHAAWLKVVEDNLGAGHSLFQQIAQFGVRETASDLFRRAEPTCFFEGRDHERFGISLTEHMVVVLPPAVGAEDVRIRNQLGEALAALSRNCTIVDGTVEEREVSVCRLNGGWYIGVENSTPVLLQRYVQAGQRNHAPHLFDLVPDAKHGQTSPGHINLLAKLTPNSNGKEVTHGGSANAQSN